MQVYFDQLNRVRYEGLKSSNPLAFRHYNPDELALGKRVGGHLRLAACYWYTFCWNGVDMLGVGTFNCPWQQPGEALALAKRKTDIAFEFFHGLRIPFYCFHGMDVSPEDASLKEYVNNFAQTVDVLVDKQEENSVRLPWGTTDCSTNPRYGAGAVTDPDPEVFSWAAMQAVTTVETTHKLGGENCVLWGDREGYEALLSIDLRQEREQLGRFMRMVVEHRHKIGFQNTLLTEPKPQEPTKHQYNYDATTVYGFLKQFGLKKGTKLNIETNYVTLADRSFHHEIATAIALGLFGSVGADRDGAQLGWSTDQFPNSVEENALMVYEILKTDGFTTGGLSFDTKVRRQSADKYDLFYGHIGAMGAIALALETAACMIGDGELDKRITQRCSGWNSELGQQILRGQMSLADLTKYAQEHNLSLIHQNGRQE